MSRSLMFRIWDLDKNEWLSESDDDALTYYGFHLIGEVMTVQSPRNWQVNGVVEQFTGLCDKNGKEIYEGDIVCFGDTKYPHIVVYEKTAFRLKNDIGVGWCPIGELEEMEVIGNIHEPPKDFSPEHLKRMGVTISKGGVDETKD